MPASNMLWMKQSRSATHKKRSVSYAHSSRPEELRLRNGAPVTVKLWPENEGFSGQLAMHHLAVYRVPPLGRVALIGNSHFPGYRVQVDAPLQAVGRVLSRIPRESRRSV